MENLVAGKKFWSGKKVLITGHTGFKGSWLTLWLLLLNANVTGISLPAKKRSLFKVSSLDTEIHNNICCDITDNLRFSKVIQSVNPEIIFHLAAQAFVRESYHSPLETFATNVMGTANLLEAARQCDTKSIVIITSDKCYKNLNWPWGYRETDALGGKDPYSASKACAEIVASSYRDSFFSQNKTYIATARAGNVIGGGDWGKDRLIPDIITAFVEDKSPVIRYPNAIRPWQHVCDPLWGYMLLAENLYQNGQLYADAFNFGPFDTSNKTVGWIADYLHKKWKGSKPYSLSQDENPSESSVLKLDSSKARENLPWNPKLSLSQALDWTVEWYQEWVDGLNMKDITYQQIQKHMELKDIID